MARVELVRAVLDEAGLGAVVLRRPENFAWYSGGADNRVDHASATGVADIVVTRDGEHVVTNNIEAPRMREEQVPGWDVVEYEWHVGPGDLMPKLAGGGGYRRRRSPTRPRSTSTGSSRRCGTGSTTRRSTATGSSGPTRWPPSTPPAPLSPRP